MKKAILNVGHPHCVGSIAIMLRSLGYEVVHLNDSALTKLNIDFNIKHNESRTQLYFMGYARPPVEFCGFDGIASADLYVGIKENNMDLMKKHFPNLKYLMFTINGGKEPYNNTKYPVVSANMYTPGFKCYVPYLNVWNLKPRDKLKEFTNPVDFLHNAPMWGFGDYIEDMEQLGVEIYGDKGSPAGLIQNSEIGKKLSTTKALVHLKGSDSPGYALYEAFASGVPVVVPQLFVDRMKYQDLYIDGETCYTFGKEAFRIENDNPDKPIETWHLPEMHAKVVEEVKEILTKLSDPDENYRIGMNGYKKWKQLITWTEDKADALESYLKQNGI